MGRIDVVRELFGSPRSFIFDQMNQPGLGEAERDEAFKLMTKIGHLARELARIEPDEQALQIEGDRVRPLLVELRQFGLRHYLTVAEPLWGWPSIQLNPSSVAYAGGDDLLPLLSKICTERGLKLKTKGTGWGAGQQRWNQLREAPVGVFDLRDSAPQARAAAAYALGSALALGVQPVVLADKGSQLPFDIDIVPAVLGGSAGDESALADALDRAFFSFTTIGAHSSVRETLLKLAERMRGQDATTRVFKKRIQERQELDPIEAQAVARQLLAANDVRDLAVFTPSWPGFYPDPHEPRCFHIMPFSEKWSDEVRDVVRQTCEEQDVWYRRGDESDEDRVIRAIWEEICRANYVIVDLSGLNVNVCLELGLTQALGRRTLLLRRSDGTDFLFPEISKLQVPRYKDAELGNMVFEFLALTGGRGT